MMRFACIKQLEIIGEAAIYISGLTKKKFADVNWREIIGLRNLLIHEYFGVDERIVWEVIKKDIPEFKRRLKSMMEEN